jgi:hypothetical protein
VTEGIIFAEAPECQLTTLGEALYLCKVKRFTEVHEVGSAAL